MKTKTVEALEFDKMSESALLKLAKQIDKKILNHKIAISDLRTDIRDIDNEARKRGFEDVRDICYRYY